MADNADLIAPDHQAPLTHRATGTLATQAEAIARGLSPQRRGRQAPPATYLDEDAEALGEDAEALGEDAEALAEPPRRAPRQSLQEGRPRRPMPAPGLSGADLAAAALRGR